MSDTIRTAAYHVVWQERTPLKGLPAGWTAANPAQGFRTYFADSGPRLVPMSAQAPEWEWDLSLARLGRASGPGPIGQAERRVNEARVEYPRAGVLEWYLNGETGLEQGFTVNSPPVGEGSLVIDLALSGGLAPAFAQDSGSVDFSTAAGRAVLHLGALRAADAKGRDLQAWFEPWIAGGQGGIRISVDDAGATYPVRVDPLATSAAWSVQGTVPNEVLGFSVQTAGDVNGDGYADVVVGAYGIDTAYVFFGSSSGLHTTPDWTYVGQTGSGFGCNVATAGDVNGDGYSDILIGAWTYSGTNVNEGAAFVFHGSPTGPSSTPNWVFASGQANANFGASVAAAGDVNGDGYGDVLVSAPDWSSGSYSYNGRAYLFNGSSSGLASSPAWTYDGEQDGELLGNSVCTAGDVNGDGYADIVIGAPGYNGGLGRALVFYGSSSGPASSPDWTYVGTQNWGGDTPYLGVSVATAGDVNGDGYSDVVIGAPYQDQDATTTQVGAVYVFHGSSTGLPSSPSWSLLGDQAGAYLGYSVFTAGDVNGDGFSDVIIGAPYYSDTVHGLVNCGAAFVYFGSSAGLSLTGGWSVLGTMTSPGNGNLGISVATAGDVYGDGYSDVIIGAFYQSGVASAGGMAEVFRGSASTLGAASGWSVGGGAGDHEFGFSVASAGDVNGDGYDDILVGDRYYTGALTQQGAAFLFLGGPAGPATSYSWMAVGSQAYALFGFSVSSAGDVNGDGYDDVIVGEPGSQTTDKGTAYLYLGGSGGLASTAAWQTSPSLAGNNVGRSVARAGDVNGDGYSDVLVAVPGGGWIYAYYGSSTGLPSSPSWSYDDTSGSTTFGWGLSTAGDVNGDGYSDILIGAPDYLQGGLATGAVFAFYGSSAGLGSSSSWSAYGQAGSRFGRTVSTAGDVDGDGYSDVIIGAPFYTEGEELQPGAAFLYRGSSSGLGLSPAWTAYGENDGDRFGISVACAGDINGDGYADVAVGAYLYNVTPEGNEGKVYVYQGTASGLPGTPTWTATGGGPGFGYCVASSGDANGDGYADLLVGTPQPNGLGSGPGAVNLFYGGDEAERPVSRRPRQLRDDDTAPIAHLGAQFGGSGGFRLASVLRSPFGRAKAKLEWEVKPLGTLFNGQGLRRSSAWQDTGTTGTSADEATGTLAWGLLYHWRARTLFTPVTNPYQGRGPWLTRPMDGWEEADLQLQYSSGDWDGDGYPNASDCAPRDPSAWAVPSVVPNQGWQAHSKSILTWQAPAAPGCVTPLYDVLRTTSASNWNSATCVASGISALTCTDSTLPPGGSQRVLFYLIRVFDACGSNMGTNSKGIPRTGRSCP